YIDQGIEIHVVAGKASRNLSQQTGSNAGNDNRCVFRQLTSRQHERTAISDSANLGFGKVLSQPCPCGGSSVVCITPDDTREPRPPGLDRLVTTVRACHLISPVRKATKDSMDIGHVGKIFVDQLGPAPRKRHSLSGCHEKAANQPSIYKLTTGKALGIGVAARGDFTIND